MDCRASITAAGPATGTFGAPIRLTATAACNTGAAEVQWLRKVNSSTVVIQPFGASATVDVTADVVGNSTFFAQARTQGTARSQATSNNVVVKVADNAPLCTAVRMTSPGNGAVPHGGHGAGADGE
ncbi:MAG: hypothetical protein H7138_19135, partial [Myxococcales bacterium]|nr:hypothetical protein [Myxococcales bacterium]